MDRRIPSLLDLAVGEPFKFPVPPSLLEIVVPAPLVPVAAPTPPHVTIEPLRAPPVCTFCGQNHKNEHFHNVPEVATRRRICKEKSLCTICTTPRSLGHTCHRRACGHCDLFHPTSLCGKKEAEQGIQMIQNDIGPPLQEPLWSGQLPIGIEARVTFQWTAYGKEMQPIKEEFYGDHSHYWEDCLFRGPPRTIDETIIRTNPYLVKLQKETLAIIQGFSSLDFPPKKVIMSPFNRH